YMPMGLCATFIDKQYEYNQGDKKIKVEKGQCVIDCGGCWGDTALYFANEVGNKGIVFTMEFIPSNLEIMEKNLDLNPQLKERIKVIKNPVWNVSNEQLYFVDQGPASIVTEIKNNNVKVYTLSIDDLVERNELKSVGFIKMDIEGAELSALNGACETIKKFRPTLAIAVYHKINDFHEVTKFINGLDLNYSFYLGHYTIYAQETVLFAVPNEVDNEKTKNLPI
ncbi:FkbM family methyltransferase, partial [Bacillus sp. JJ722]|uniref:FkbM family methyltransferase n=1 Tax=Bacillus sp. JJ722 TaxID=3122973 RepID=UPI002FFD740D